MPQVRSAEDGHSAASTRTKASVGNIVGVTFSAVWSRSATLPSWQQSLAEAEHFVGAMCPKGGLLVDPFAGAATTLVAAKRLGINWIGIDVDEE